jgi:hypothetical protein
MWFSAAPAALPDYKNPLPSPRLCTPASSHTFCHVDTSVDTYITDPLSGFVGVKLNGQPYWTVDSEDHLSPGVWNTNSFTYTTDSTSLTLTFEFLAGFIGAQFVIDNVSVVPGS